MDSLPKTKAVLSLPSSMSIQTSSIPHAGLGVFALTTFEVGSLFGPMDGEKLSTGDHAQRGNNPYVWEVRLIFFLLKLHFMCSVYNIHLIFLG